MKFEVLKEKISKELSKAEKMTGKNLSLPVLESILFEVGTNNLTLRSTNLDLGIEIKIPVKSEKEGRAAVPAKVVISYLNNIKDGEKLVFETTEGVLNIHSKLSQVSINTIPNEDFPVIPQIDAEDVFTIKSKDLVGGLKAVVYASSISSMKPELSSVYMFKDENDLVFVATDSFRLAEKRIPANDVKLESGILIPFKNALEIMRVCEDAPGEIEVMFNKNQLSVSFENVYMVSRVVDGVFPDYGQIIPKEFTTTITALKQDVLNSFKVINIFSDKFNQVQVLMNPEEKQFTISTKNNSVGQSENNIPAVIEGEPLSISFNHRYIVDSFSSLNTDSLTFNFSGPGKPMVMRPVSDRSFMYLVMPMNK
jgi:DNA polymerase III subunit beta